MTLSDAYMRPSTSHHWFRYWLVAWPAPSHYLNQCWIIVNRNLSDRLQGNHKQNSYIFITENAFENAVCEMAAICIFKYIHKIIASVNEVHNAWGNMGARPLRMLTHFRMHLKTSPAQLQLLIRRPMGHYILCLRWPILYLKIQTVNFWTFVREHWVFTWYASVL